VLLAFTLFFATKTFWRMNVYKTPTNYLNEGIADCPDNFFFLYQKGNILSAEKNYSDALECFTKAIRLSPNRAVLYNNRANVYSQLARKEEAIADYTRALELSNYKREVYLSRCLAYRKFGDIEKCAEDLINIERRYPGYISPELRDDVLAQWYDFKIAAISHAINLQPNNADLYANRAKLYADRQMINEAKQDLKRACELEPANETYKKYFEKALLMH
jgi:tetratricopeptide (TPR) repeat protein